MIGVVVPAHNEERCLPACLAAIRQASLHPGLAGEPVRVLVVLDACTDATAAVARAQGVDVLEVNARNVGLARATGACELIAAGARWLAFTDADTVVSAGWLHAQLALQSDAVCGSVSVEDWSGHAEEVRSMYLSRYADRDGHRHIHGANFGVSTEAYLRAGGFAPLLVSEDVALVQALEAVGARIAWSAAPRVSTSARKDARARGGFGDYLLSLAASVQ